MTATNQVENHRRFMWLLCVALVTLLIATCLFFWIPHHQQIVLLDRIEAAGGKYHTQSVGPEWLRNILGDEGMLGFDAVVLVLFNSSKVDDDLLQDISTLSELQTLDLGNTQVTDAGLAHLISENSSTC